MLSFGLVTMQFLRDTRTTTGKEWHELSEEDQEKLKRHSFLQAKQIFSQELEEAETKAMESLDTSLGITKHQRHPNRDWLAKLDGQLRAGCGWGLSRFLPKRRARPLPPGHERVLVTVQGPDGKEQKRSVVKEEVGGARWYEVCRLLQGGVRKYPCLHLAIDQGSVGLLGSLMLLVHVGLRMTLTMDLFHRVTNDLVDATSEAGLTVIRLEYLRACKVRLGPWQGQAHHQIMRASAAEMARVWSWETLVFQILYRDLVEEHPTSLNSASVGTEEHMKFVWSWCCHELQTCSTGADAKNGRWFSWESQSRRSVDRRWLDVLLLCFIGVRRKWWKNLSANPLFSMVDAARDDGAEPLPGEAAAAVGAEEVEMVEGRLVDRRVSVAEGRAEVSRRRMQCASALQFTCNLLCRDLNCRLWRGMAFLTLPLERFFNKARSGIKTIRGTEHLHIELALKGMHAVCLELFQHFFSEEYAGHIGLPKFMGGGETPFIKQQSDIVHSRLYIMLHTLSGQLLMTGAAYTAPPYCFLALLHKEEGVRRAKLRELKEAWGAFQRLEHHAQSNGPCRLFVDELLCCNTQFSLECFVRLHEMGFEDLPTDMTEDLQAFARSFLSSLVCEDFFRHLKEVAKDNAGKRLDPATMYHAAASAGDTLTRFGRPSMPITGAARAAAHTNKLPSNFFEHDLAKFSLGAEVLDEIMTPRPSWPTMGPTRLLN